MRRPLSLALRVTLLFGIVAAIVFPIFGWMIVRSTEHRFVAEDSDELTVVADAVYDLLQSTDAGSELDTLRQRFADFLVGHHDASLRLTGPDNQLVYASSGPDLAAVAAAAADISDPIREWTQGDNSYRILTRSLDLAGPNDDGPYQLVVAVPIDHHLRFLSDFRRSLWLMIAISIALMSLMGWIAVRQGHAPLHDIVGRVRRISADKLNARLAPETVPAELAELAISFNDMLQRVDGAFRRLSEFNADIAHELRTPIANLMTQTQVGLSRARTSDEYREILYSNMEEYERMAQMVADMLYLAKADSQARLQGVTEVDLALEVRTLFEFYDGWADERGVTLVLDGTATVAGDRAMLQRAFSNLLSNAIRHTPDGGTVEVAIDASEGGFARVIIENPGADIPPEHLPRLFDRFYRIDQSRQKGDQGVGLGLAMVKSIVNAHHGDIDVDSGGGITRFTVSLPSGTAGSVN